MTDPRWAFVGKSVARREDKHLLLGEGQFVGDMVLPRMAHVAFLRSPLPHARVKSIDLTAARAMPGVFAAYSGQDLHEQIGPLAGMQVVMPKGWRERFDHKIEIPGQPLIAIDKARYVGESVALVVASDRYVCEDAIELINVDLEALPAVVDPYEALKPGTAIVHEALKSNEAGYLRTTKGQGGAAMDKAPRRLKRKFTMHRYAAMPMECRAILADYDARTDSLTIWSSTQVVHWVRREVAMLLKMPEERVRCIAPDVGGGFGGKGHVYPEDLMVAFLAKRLRRPVKWMEDRQEHIANSAHARDNVHELEIGFDDSGRIHALKDTFVLDSGAYSPIGTTCAVNSVAHSMGPYDIPHLEAEGRVVITNKTPNAPYRGAGRPEIVFAVERAVDLVASACGMEPTEVRLRNMITPDRMPFDAGLPYRDGVPIKYDSGDYPKALRRAIEELCPAKAGGIDAFRKRQAEARTQSRYLGIGFGCYVEGTGVGPFEGATVRVDPSGMVIVATGSCAQGQAHETIFAQIAAQKWCVPLEQVVVTVSDTAAVPMGYGTIASRSAVTGSAAVLQASDKVQDKVLAVASNMLEAASADLEFRDGGVGVKGVPNMHVTLKQIAQAAKPGWDHKRPEGVEAGLEANAYYEPPTVTWSYATNAAIVEVDANTGAIRIEKYVSVHDAGVLINPTVAENQVRGGLVQGIGGTLFEEIRYDEHGQLLTGSFMDYLLPTASDTPPITVVHHESPSPLNPLGVKGLGEGGAIAPPAVIANAVSDALRSFGAEFNATPVRWEDCLRAIQR